MGGCWSFGTRRGRRARLPSRSQAPETGGRLRRRAFCAPVAPPATSAVPVAWGARESRIRPFDEATAVAAARWFRDHDIDTIGVCLLHSYANPAHELRVREVLAREHPGAVVSLSCEVLPEYREYERAVTTLVDAAVKPTIASRLRALDRRIPALPALVWLALMVARLALGPLVPRIS